MAFKCYGASASVLYTMIHTVSAKVVYNWVLRHWDTISMRHTAAIRGMDMVIHDNEQNHGVKTLRWDMLQWDSIFYCTLFEL